MKKTFSILVTGVLAICFACALMACSGAQGSSSSGAASKAADQGILRDAHIVRNANFGGIDIEMSIDEFNSHGFEYGDSVDVVFSNGYELKGIPYYNGYYARTGDVLICAYPGYEHPTIAINNGDSLWDVSGVSASDTVTIKVAQAGAYMSTQNAFNITYSNRREDYASDEAFANFREMSGGKLRPRTFYRSASPVDNQYNRVPYVGKLMADANIAYVLDLSDNIDEINAHIADDEAAGVDVSYFKRLLDAGSVGSPDLASNYISESYARKLVAALVEMSKHDGPYLVHCVEGKDRTGFVSVLIEALAGASYDEMLDDYMKTYANYYGITKESDPERYEVIRNLNFDGFMSFLTGTENADELKSFDYFEPASNYLRGGGMTQEQLDALIALIRG